MRHCRRRHYKTAPVSLYYTNANINYLKQPIILYLIEWIDFYIAFNYASIPLFTLVEDSNIIVVFSEYYILDGPSDNNEYTPNNVYPNNIQTLQ